jgi:hypothetical protein
MNTFIYIKVKRPEKMLIIHSTTNKLQWSLFSPHIVIREEGLKLCIITILLLLMVQAVPASGEATTKYIEIGNFDYAGLSDVTTFQNDARLTWDVYGRTSTLLMQRTEIKRVYQNFLDPTRWKGLTDLDLIQSRFDLATQYKDYYDYGVFLLQEEVYQPKKMCSWGYSRLSDLNIEGTRTFAGVTVKLLKDWYIEKYGTWNQAWWDSIRSANNYDDAKFSEWSGDYAYGLYRAWKNHTNSLGKKTAIIGLIGARDFQANNDVNAILNSFYPSPIKEYILANYDLLILYKYPMNLEQVAWEEDFVKKLRAIYSGKIGVILTSAFSDFNWEWSEEVAFEEFKRVYPYVDVIVVYHHADLRDWNNPKSPYPPYLIKFYESISTLNPSPIISFQYHFREGLNLISLPLVSNYSASSLTSAIGDNAKYIIKRDTATGEYKSYIAGFSSLEDDFQISPDEGYYIFVSKECNFTVSGIGLEGRKITLTKGWNLIGWPSLNTTSITKAFEKPLNGSLEYVVFLNETSNGYTTYIPEFTSADYLIEPGRGYYLRVSSNCTLKITV